MAQEKSKSTALLYTSIILFAVFGMGLASYLFYQYLAPPHKSLCYINATINCEESTKGSLANTLGIPTALWGFTGYIIILISAIKRWKRLLFGMALFGLLFCLRITILEVFFLKVICPVCLLCQLNMIAIFLLGIKLFNKEN